MNVAQPSHLAQIRRIVCERCCHRWPDAPPCGPLGKGCGMDGYLPKLWEICRTHADWTVNQCLVHFEQTVCPSCHLADTKYCTCPMNYLLPLAIQVIRAMDQLDGADVDLPICVPAVCPEVVAVAL